MKLQVSVEGRKLLYLNNADTVVTDGLIFLIRDEYPELENIALDGFEVEVGFTATQEVEVELEYLSLVSGAVNSELDIVDVQEV